MTCDSASVRADAHCRRRKANSPAAPNHDLQASIADKPTGCPTGWKESLNGKNWELTTWFRVTAWRKLADAVNQYLEKGSQVFVEGELRGDASDGSQNPRIWTGNDGEHRASTRPSLRLGHGPHRQVPGPPRGQRWSASG